MGKVCGQWRRRCSSKASIETWASAAKERMSVATSALGARRASAKKPRTVDRWWQMPWWTRRQNLALRVCIIKITPFRYHITREARKGP